MKKIILFLVVIMFFNLISATHYYKIHLDYDKGNLKIKNIDLIVSNWNLTEDISDKFIIYKAEFFSDEKIYETEFNLPNFEFYDVLDNETGFMEGGKRELNKFNFSIYLPYYEDAKEIKIYDNYYHEVDNSLLEYSKDNSENFLKDLKKEKSDIKKESPKKVSEDKINYNLIISFILFLILIFLIYYLVKSVKK